MGKGKREDAMARYRRYLHAEREAVALYGGMAEAEPNPRRAQVFRELAESEHRHVAHWASKLGTSVEALPPFRPPLRVRLLAWLARNIGTRAVLPLVLRIEGDDTKMYGGDPEAAWVMAEGEGHSQALQGLREGRHGRNELEAGWRVVVMGGALRAGVLGVNDGLVSNFSLVWGVAGGGADPQIVLLAGVAGLLAGAFSMAAGEYVSMRAQRDMAEHRIEAERMELEEFPEEEKEELSLIYRLKGLPKEEADLMAERIMQNRTVALNTLVREELGLDPAQLGAPWGATISSFVSFAAGAAVPVLPYALRLHDIAFSLSGGLSAAALFVVGAALAFLSSRNAAWGGLRMLMVGVVAATVTFGIGRLIGISLA